LPLTPHHTPLLQLPPEQFVAHQVSGVQALAAIFFFAAKDAVEVIEIAATAKVATKANLATDFIMVKNPPS
jgi:hypothetical protein